MPRGITVSGTSISVTAGGTLGMHITGVPNYLNITKVKIQPSGGSGPYDFEIFGSGAFGAGSLLAKWKNVTSNIYDPMDISGGGPVEGNPSDLIVAYEDTDGTGEIHLKFSNHDSVDRTYAYTIVYEPASTSGSYTPTLTNGTNVAASTAYSCQYIRVGNVVTVTGFVDVDPTAGGSTNTTIDLSLPFASNLGTTTDCAGIGVSPAVNSTARIDANTTSDRATMTFTSLSAASQFFYFTFTYRVIN